MASWPVIILGPDVAVLPGLAMAVSCAKLAAFGFLGKNSAPVTKVAPVAINIFAVLFSRMFVNLFLDCF
jgi:hypothetical protein